MREKGSEEKEREGGQEDEERGVRTQGMREM